MISIVTPSRNQGAYLETAMLSVLTQGAEVEYVVMDGASDDGSAAIVERHADRLHAWASEPDGGQYDAIEQGFARTSGEIMGWLNSDDFYFPGCLSAVEGVFARFPEIDWLVGTIAAIANPHGHVVRTLHVPRFGARAFLRGYNLPMSGWHAGHFIPQESTFWRRSLWERAGGRLDASLDLAGDFELWLRFLRHAEPWGLRALLGCYRSHEEQKTRTSFEAYRAEAEAVLRTGGGEPYGPRETRLRGRLARASSATWWRVPPRGREALVERGLLHRTRELVWNGSDWAVSTEYYV